MQVPPEILSAIRTKAAEIIGGQDEFNRLAEAEMSKVQAVWNQNTEVIGRILRSHLFVEHFMTEYLQRRHPTLGSLSKAKLTFAQKAALLNQGEEEVAEILPGIQRLNAIRNRLAHRLDTEVSEEDANVFMSCGIFSERHATKATADPQLQTPLAVLEAFARHTSIVFTHGHSAIANAMTQAIQSMLPNRSDA